MLNVDIENLSIIKESNDDMLNYFNQSYMDNMGLIQSLKSKLFELTIKIEETKKTKDLYSFKSDSKRNLFSPLANEGQTSNDKQRILENQLSDLYIAKDSLEKRIAELEESLTLLQNRLNKLQAANNSINILLDSSDYSSIDNTLVDKEGFEFIEDVDSKTSSNINNNYNILMLQEYKNNRIASILNTSIKQQLLNNSHKADILSWLLNSDIERARITLKEILSSYSLIIEDIDNISSSLNYDIDTTKPIWLMIDNLIAHYRDIHPECTIELNSEYPDYEINLHPVVTINLVNILKELLENAFTHSNANKITISIYISSHIINVYINDNGVGIHPDYLTKSKWHSGLHWIHEIIHILNGQISIDGDLISGTNARFSFPILRR